MMKSSIIICIILLTAIPLLLTASLRPFAQHSADIKNRYVNSACKKNPSAGCFFLNYETLISQQNTVNGTDYLCRQMPKNCL